MQLGSLSKLYSGTSLVKAAYVGSNRFYRNISAQSAVNGFVPGLCFDFVKDAYATDSRPATFGDSITHSATTNATMVDSDGVLKWRPHNLLTYSEDVNTGWALNNFLSTADNLLIPSTVDSYHYIENSTASGVYDFTWEFEAKPEGYTFVRLFNQIIGVGVDIDLVNKTFSNKHAEIADPVITDGAGGYVRVSCEYVGPRTNKRLSLQPMPSALNTATFAGDGVSGVRVRQLSMFRSDLGGMVNNPDTGNSYVPTTSAARYLPRRGHHVWNGSAWVNEGLLHESEARTNLLTYSQDFTDASWATSSVGVSVSPNDTISPDGNNNAAKITSTGATSYFGKNTTSGTSAFTVRVKYINNQWVALNFGGGATTAVWFDVQNGTVGTETSGYTGLISNVGGGWYECTIVGNNANNVVYIWPAVNGDGTVLGTSGKSCHIYGAQLEEVSTPSSYIPTSGSTVTRAVETLTIPAAKLPWPTPNVIGPELVTNGTFDDGISGWEASTGGGSAVSLQDQKLRVTSVGTLQGISGYSTTPVSLSAGKTYFISGSITGVSNTSALNNVNVSLRSGTNATVDFVAGPSVTISDGQTIAYSYVYTPSSNQSLYVHARMFKNSAVSTVVVVDFDNVSVREIDPLAVSIQMQGRMTYADTNTGFELIPLYWHLDGSNNIQTILSTASTRTGEMTFWQEAGGVIDTVASNTYSPGINVPFNIASRHGSTFINGAVDGTALTANTTPTALPDLSTTDLQLGFDYMGTIKLFRVWADDLTDGGLVEATEPSLEPSLSLTFDGTENSFIVQDWSE